MEPERNVKIVATLGPSSNTPDRIRELIRAGMNVARLNFSHGTHAEHAARIEIVRTISDELNKPVAILQDLQGPKLRVGLIPGDHLDLKNGDTIVLSSNPQAAEKFSSDDCIFIPMDVPDLENSVGPGGRILMDDGNLELTVIKVTPDAVEAKVVFGGVLKSHKGVNLPDASLTIPGFTEKDQADLEFGLNHGVDMLAISFVRTAEDISKVREQIKRLAPQQSGIPIIAKIELPKAIENLHEILQVSDGVMVARGDLGVEMSPASVPNLQKEIIQHANRHAKLVITATQMLESMITNPRPTRAEASDVANAVFDGTDAVMLSAETAAGAYPVETINIMNSIVCDAEAHYDMWGHYRDVPKDAIQSDALSITWAARELAYDREVAAIAVFTEFGKDGIVIQQNASASAHPCSDPYPANLSAYGFVLGSHSYVWFLMRIPLSPSYRLWKKPSPANLTSNPVSRSS